MYIAYLEIGHLIPRTGFVPIFMRGPNPGFGMKSEAPAYLPSISMPTLTNGKQFGEWNASNSDVLVLMVLFPLINLLWK